MHIRLMPGLGDTIYQRPFVVALAKKYDLHVMTSWPQVFADLNVKFTKHHKYGGIAQRLSENYFKEWSNIPPDGRKPLSFHWEAEDLTNGIPILTSIKKHFPFDIEVPSMSLPKFKNYPKFSRKKYAVVRPPTVRQTWNSEKRNCLNEYIQSSIDILKVEGYEIVTLATAVNQQETFTSEPLRGIDYDMSRGEATPDDFFSIVSNAKLLVGSPSWILPMGIASNVPTIIIHGGIGGHNRPELLDMHSQLNHILPDKYCMCTTIDHNCDRTISGFELKFKRIINGIDLGR